MTYDEALKSEKVIFPDYKDSILNLSNSILKHFGIKPEHETLEEADVILSRNYNHVVVILLDGLGMNILNHNLTMRDFMRRHLLKDYSAVFPPTTTASTTSFLSGLSPIEHGWLGWDMYFEQEDKTVTCFTNNLQHSEQAAADYNVAQKYLPYENIIEKINKTNKAKAYGIFPFGSEPYPELYKWIDAIRKTCRGDKKTFTYAYWENPDAQLHLDGVDSNSIYKIVKELNSAMIDLCESLKDTVVFITADHGHTQIWNDFLEDSYPDFTKMLTRPTSIEQRTVNFFVKPEYKDVFSAEFNKHFGDDFVLMTKQEALDKNLFGDGTPNPNMTGLGDFVAAATSPRTLVWNKKCKNFKSHHAGLTENEMRIPLIWYETKNRKLGMIIYYTIIGLLIFFLGYIIFV